MLWPTRRWGRPSTSAEVRLRRRRTASLTLLALLLPLLGGLVGLTVAVVTPVRYTAHAYVLFSGAGSADEVTPSQIAQATARVATTESVLAAGDASGVLLAASTNDDLTAQSSPDAPLLDFAATADTAQGATDLADQWARTVTDGMSSATSGLTMESSVFAYASTPREPVAPNYFVSVVAGIAFGAFLAAVTVILRRPQEDSGR